MVDLVTLGALQRVKYPLFSYSPPLTANSGGVQAGATLCPASINTFTTVAGAGYSGVLPPAVPGRQVSVINSGANSMNIFPNGTDAIDLLGASNAYALINGGTLNLECTATGQWWSDAPATGVSVTLAGTQTLKNKTLVDVINQDAVASTATTNFNTTTTLANITGLSVALTAGGTYTVEAAIPVSSGGSGGAKVALTGSGGLTASAVSYTANTYTASGVAVGNATSLATGVGSTATVLLAQIAGVVVVATAGTLVVQGSQNASNGTTTSFLPQGYLKVTRVS